MQVQVVDMVRNQKKKKKKKKGRLCRSSLFFPNPLFSFLSLIALLNLLISLSLFLLQCPSCKSGALDLSPAAFAKIAHIDQGRVPISWERCS